MDQLEEFAQQLGNLVNKTLTPDNAEDLINAAIELEEAGRNATIKSLADTIESAILPELREAKFAAAGLYREARSPFENFATTVEHVERRLIMLFNIGGAADEARRLARQRIAALKAKPPAPDGPPTDPG